MLTVAPWRRHPPRTRSCGVLPGRCVACGARDGVPRRPVASASVGVTNTPDVSPPAVRAGGTARAHPGRSGVGIRGGRRRHGHAPGAAPVRAWRCGIQREAGGAGRRGIVTSTASCRARCQVMSRPSCVTASCPASSGARLDAECPTTVGQPNLALLLTMRPAYCDQDSLWCGRIAAEGQLVRPRGSLGAKTWCVGSCASDGARRRCVRSWHRCRAPDVNGGRCERRPSLSVWVATVCRAHRDHVASVIGRHRGVSVSWTGRFLRHRWCAGGVWSVAACTRAGARASVRSGARGAAGAADQCAGAAS